MIGILTAAIVAFLLYFSGNPPDPEQLKMVFAAVSGLLILSGSLLFAGAYGALQKGEQNSIPRLIQLIREDKILKTALGFLLALPPLLFLPIYNHLFPIAILLIGAGLDSLYLVLIRLLDHLNPYKIVQFLTQKAKNAVAKDRDSELCETIDSLSDLGVRAIYRHNSSLANQTIDALEISAESFLKAEKSPSHPVQSAELKKEGVKDTLSYVLIYLLQNLEVLFLQALDKKMEFVLGHLITTFSKLISFCAKTDLSLATFPLHYTGKLSQMAMDKGMSDVGVKTTVCLLEVSKSIPNLKEIAYMDIKPFFISLITILDNTAKEIFKHDKSTNIAILTEPFITLKSLFQTEPLKSHQDATAVNLQIDKVIQEFQALDNLLKTMPPLPSLNL